MIPGILSIDGDAYHRDPCPEPSLSSSLAKVILAQSPLHAWTQSPRLNPEWEPTEKKTFDIGRAAHRAVLGKGGDYAAIPAEILASNGAASTKEAKAFIEDCRARGVTPVKESEAARVEAMAAKLKPRLAEMRIDLDPARSEMVGVALIDGIWCRCMVDNAPLMAREPIYDFKTCESADPDACRRSVVNYGYDVQAAHYRETWRSATGEDRAFRFIFQEKTAPFEVCVIELGRDTLDLASRKIARAREMWRMCLTRNEWPGYPAGVHMIDLPAWEFQRWLERESVEADHKRQYGADILEAAMRFQHPQGFQGDAE